MQKDLDVIIEHVHVGERMGMLEFPDKTSDVNIQRILADILKEASGLKMAEGVNCSVLQQESKIILPVSPVNHPEKLRSIDKLMYKLPFYKKLRPWLKRKLIPMPYTIDGLTLLQYNNKEFIRAAYLGILGRPADQTDIENLIVPVVSGDISKIQLIDNLLKSEEHTRKNIGVRGLGFKRFKEKLIHGILKIPVLGYLLRFFKNLIYLSRQIRQMNRRLSLLEYSLEETNKNFVRIETILKGKGLV